MMKQVLFLPRPQQYRALSIIGAALCMAWPVLAQASPKLEGTFGDWSAYSRTDNGETLCYALSKAKSQSPNNVRHGDIYFMIASWKSGAATEQPSFIAGYALKPESPPRVSVGSADYTMYADQNEAFIQESSDERSLVKAMRRGSTMRVSAMSARGTAVNYSFSLKGVSAALTKTKQRCD